MLLLYVLASDSLTAERFILDRIAILTIKNKLCHSEFRAKNAAAPLSQLVSSLLQADSFWGIVKKRSKNNEDLGNYGP